MTFRGHLELRAEAGAGGRGSFLARQSFGGPFHVGKARLEDGVLQVQVVNPTAGILEGDEMRVELEAGAGASLCVTTPAAARAFRMAEGGAGARVLQRLSVEEGGWLEYAPEPLYPHAGTRLEQRTLLDLAGEGAEACVTDSLAPGRAARGELWGWARLANTTVVSRKGIRLLTERLEAAGGELGALAEFHGGRETWLATVFVVSARVPVAAGWWEPLAAVLAREGGLRAGVTRPCAGLHVVRLAAPSGQAQRDALAAVREQLALVLPGLRVPLRR